MADTTCQHCKHWSGHREIADRAECRVDPPASDGQQGRTWPITFKDDWCGHFSRSRIPPPPVKGNKPF